MRTFFIVLLSTVCALAFIILFTKAPADSFKEVIIGNQVWMAENLSVDKFRNGEPIPHAKTAEEWKKAAEYWQPAWCYYDNDSSNGEKYGKLYNWHAVNDARGLAPEGWHVPSEAEWRILTDYLGGRNVAGKKMKSTELWKSYNENQENGNGTNESGFSGLPGGSRGERGLFSTIGSFGDWWSSTELIGNPSTLILFNSSDGLLISNRPKEYGLSVRCIKGSQSDSKTTNSKTTEGASSDTASARFDQLNESFNYLDLE